MMVDKLNSNIIWNLLAASVFENGNAASLFPLKYKEKNIADWSNYDSKKTPESIQAL